MGLVFIAVVIWAPGGVMGIFKKWLTDAKER
jgi:ABC-type branched-subunit amino acid transport system permease subunit